VSDALALCRDAVAVADADAGAAAGSSAATAAAARGHLSSLLDRVADAKAGRAGALLAESFAAVTV
jgi:hypothetical protein